MNSMLDSGPEKTTTESLFYDYYIKIKEKASNQKVDVHYNHKEIVSTQKLSTEDKENDLEFIKDWIKKEFNVDIIKTYEKDCSNIGFKAVMFVKMGNDISFDCKVQMTDSINKKLKTFFKENGHYQGILLV